MKRKILICEIIILIIAAICLVGLLNKESGGEKSGLGKGRDEKIALGSDVFITSIDPYIGAFVEDGTDEYVENALSITVENNGSEYIQLMNVTIDEKYVFNITTLFPGEKMIVLEQSRAEYKRGINMDDVVVSNVALFDEEPSMHTELLEISGEDNQIFVKNISEKAFSGGKVFYKNKFEDKYIGGITYTRTIPMLKKGQTVVLDSMHYLKDSSELIFVTYAEQ